MTRPVDEYLRELNRTSMVNPAWREWLKRYKPASKRRYEAERALNAHIFSSLHDTDASYEAKRSERDAAELELAKVMAEKPPARIPRPPKPSRRKRAR